MMWPCFWRASVHLCAIFVLIIGTLPNGKISIKLKQSLADSRRGLKKDPQLEKKLQQSSSLLSVHSHKYDDERRNGTSVVIADLPLRRRLSRRRRSVLQLASMLKCVTGCSPLSFQGYGCFCGYLGDGAPVDSIDTCCLEHDWCYSATHCSHLSTYLLPYSWHCSGPGFAYCAFEGSLSPDASCGHQLCECDLQFARCISRYPCPGHRARCRYGGSSSNDHNTKKAIDQLADHIKGEDDESKKTVKTKKSRKITLTAGIRKEPFSQNLLPNVHASVEVESNKEEDKNKPVKKIIVHDPHVHHHVVFAQPYNPFVASGLPIDPVALPGHGFASGQPGGDSGFAGAGGFPSFDGAGLPGGIPNFDGIPNAGVPNFGSGDSGFGGGGSVGVNFGFGGFADGAFGFTGVGSSEVERIRQQGLLAGNAKKKEPIVLANGTSGQTANSVKKANQNAASNVSPRFDKVFQDEGDVIRHLRTSPRPISAGSSQSWFQRYYSQLPQLINRNFNRTFEFTMPNPRSKLERISTSTSEHTSAGNTLERERSRVESTTKSPATGRDTNSYYGDRSARTEAEVQSNFGSNRRSSLADGGKRYASGFNGQLPYGGTAGVQKEEYYGEQFETQKQSYDPERISYKIENPFTQQPRTSRLHFPGASRP